MWAILAICSSVYNDWYSSHANNHDWHVRVEVKTSCIYFNSATSFAYNIVSSVLQNALPTFIQELLYPGIYYYFSVLSNVEQSVSIM